MKGAPVRSSPYGAAFQAGGEELATLWVGDLPGETTDTDLLDAFIQFGQIVSASVSRRPAASGARSGFVRFSCSAEADSALNVAALGSVAVHGQVATAQWARSNSTGGASGGGSGHAPQEFFSPEVHSFQPAFRSFGPMPSFPKGHPSGKAGGKAAPPIGLGAWRPPTGSGAGAGGSRGAIGGSFIKQEVYVQPTEELATIFVGNLQEGTENVHLAAAFGDCGEVVSATVNSRPSPMGSYSGFVRFAARDDAEMALALCLGGEMIVGLHPCVGSWAKVNSKIDTSFMG